MAAVKKNTIKCIDYIGGSLSIPDPRVGFLLLICQPLCR